MWFMAVGHGHIVYILVQFGWKLVGKFKKVEMIL
jgi:hypothetical protein